MWNITRKEADKFQQCLPGLCGRNYFTLITLYSFFCRRIENIVYSYEHSRVLYDWIPPGCELTLFKYVVRPSTIPLSQRVFHLMLFMRWYRGKYTYRGYRELYSQYLCRYWMTYYCVKVWVTILLLKAYYGMQCPRQKLNATNTNHLDILGV